MSEDLKRRGGAVEGGRGKEREEQGLSGPLKDQ